MAQERKVNRGESTLDGAINNSVTSLDVNDASSFPSSPQFRILIDDEIMLVTAVSSNTFTVTRAAEGPGAAASHSDAAEVKLVETEAGQVRFQRDWSNPLWGLGKPMQLLDSSGNTLTASSFTDVNFSAGTKTDLASGSIYVERGTQAASNSYAIIKKAAPTAPWTLRVGFIPNLLNELGDFPSCGVVVRDSSTGEFYSFQIRVSADGVWIQVVKLTSPTVSSTSFLAFQDWVGGSGIVWFEIEDNNTNLIFKYSADGVNFIVLGQEPRTTFLTPDEIGVAINNFGSGSVEAGMTLVAWDES